jgi:hypothetical protein
MRKRRGVPAFTRRGKRMRFHQRPVTLDGRPIEGQNEGSPLYVMAMQDGHWRIVAAQNTEVLNA